VGDSKMVFAGGVRHDTFSLMSDATMLAHAYSHVADRGDYLQEQPKKNIN
jgi:hypothetical protein